jgi:hypothetical protein
MDKEIDAYATQLSAHALVSQSMSKRIFCDVPTSKDSNNSHRNTKKTAQTGN